MPAKFIAIGDIAGKIGRRAIVEVLPSWKKKYRPDLVIANAENIAHGSGMTRKTLAEVQQAGVDIFTSGDHAFRKPEASEIMIDEASSLIRPANYPTGTIGPGVKIANLGNKKVLVVNLLGQVFIKEAVNNPFTAFNEIYQQHHQSVDAILVDFHAEATSEKIAMGWHVAGRAEALWGTHTHVMTADERILEEHTAYITDIGMTGERDSVIGVKKDIILNNFLEKDTIHHDFAETGWARVDGIYFEIDLDERKAVKIMRLSEAVEIK
ncbi:MAG: TIGR00282 family metallophosphoesterase [Patescibacteria group bacterium]